MQSLIGCHSTRKRVTVRTVGLLGTNFGENGGYLYRLQAKGVMNLCAQESWARTGALKRKLICNSGQMYSYESQPGAANEQDSWVAFQGNSGLWTDGCQLGRQLHSSSRPPRQWTSVI